MIQLNNYQTGAVIIIDKMKPSGVFYKKYSNPYFKDLGINAEDKRADYVSNDFQSKLTNPTFEQVEFEGCIANVIAAEEVGFEVSNDEQCWLTEIDGYDISGKMVRIVANENLVAHIGKLDDLGQLFLGLQQEFFLQYIVIKGITYVYISFLDEQYKPLLEAYPDTVKIENKLRAHSRN